MEPLIKAPLQRLFQLIAQAQTETELRQAFMDAVGEYFAAKRWSLYFLDQLPAIDDSTPSMLKKALSLDYNPVLRYLVQNHAAVHDEVVLPPGVWQTICPRADHGHVMVGPVVSQGQLVGGIAVTRHRHDAKFTAENLADLNALCLHVSTRLAALRTQPAPLQFNYDCLTPRESQIAELVAQGLTNKEIGAELWITENSVKQALKRMFRKLKVSSRAEMVAQLAA
ncbi:MAG: LuxR C-terminal-related transcriptional regulator [Cyanobacteria bacterium P01_F01_bin.116]